MNTAHIRLLLALAATSVATPALSHHSTAMFDFSKKVEMTGTVKDFEWTNPHTWTNVSVEGGQPTISNVLANGCIEENALLSNDSNLRTVCEQLSVP